MNLPLDWSLREATYVTIATIVAATLAVTGIGRRLALVVLVMIGLGVGIRYLLVRED